MKKLIYLFFISAILVSCNSNDNEDEMLDPVIGTWKLESYSENGIEFSTECEKKSTITFSKDGTTQLKDYFDDGDGCISESESSTWVNIGNSSYKIDNDEEAVKLNFSQNNTVFTASNTETDGGTTYNITVVYKKI